MSSEIKIKSDVFYEAVTLLKEVKTNLNNSVYKISTEGNKLANTWDSKSGNNFNAKNKSLISNIKLLSNNIEELSVELNNINSTYEQTDKLISSKLVF